MEKGKVSIVLPCYNHGKYVADSIRSALNQTYENFELFVFDNGSIDDSWNVINSFCDDRMVKMRFEVNDINRVKQTFFSMATGEYCAILYSDDVWLEEKLEKQMQFLEKYDEAKVCFTWAEQVDEKLNPIQGYVNYRIACNGTRNEWFNSFLTRSNHLSCPSLLCKREIYGEFFARLYPFRQIADFYTWFSILGKTNLYIVEDVLVKQRVHNEEFGRNESARTDENMYREYIEMNEVLYRVINEYDNMSFRSLCLNENIEEKMSEVELRVEKFWYLLNLKNTVFETEELAKRYYFENFGFCEKNIVFYQLVQKKYGFSRNDFFDMTGKQSKIVEKYESRLMRWKLLSELNTVSNHINREVLIYGCADIGRALYKKIKDNIKVKGFIDRIPRDHEYLGLPLTKPEEAQIDAQDIVVVVPSYDFDVITSNLLNVHKHISRQNILTFEDFIKLIGDNE